ncbi:hypothetical protein J2T60_001429 [Natronospira proteinivora]|uniref:Uncharacterized protein n=1 Tax=Natronospira proteinivora TaxID=1807133 RepID=A0ABT1G841_9GAMM|nr:hypothetical protein [Natronospira proteinivora]MCP1727464.1 hypothetical protein [Natronospira proteinivora]
MRGNWKCSIRRDAAEALGFKHEIDPKLFDKVVHAKNTPREAAVAAALYELLPGDLCGPVEKRQLEEYLIACEQDDSDWPRTH